MTAAIGLKRLGIVVAAILVVAFGTLAVISLVMPADAVREAVQAQIRAVTGLDPVLRGDVKVSLFPTGTATFNDVSLGDKSTGEPALTTEQLVVRLRFFPLLAGKIQIADVSLVRPTIAISFAHDGSSNWSGYIESLARALSPSPDRVTSFSEIRIDDGTVVLRDEAHNIDEKLEHIEFALAWPSISKTFAATGRFVWHDEPLDVTLSLNDFVAALAGDRSGLKARIAGAPLKFAFDGYISYRPTLKMEGTLAADSASLRDTLRWAVSQAPPAGGFGRFALKAQTNIAAGNISLSSVNVELDGNSGEGVLTLAGDERTTLQGTIAADALNLTPYISTVRLMTSGGGRNWNSVPIALDSASAVDVDLRLSAARITLAQAQLGRTAVAINLRSGNLAVTIGESQAFGGVVKGSFGISGSKAGADLKAQLQFSDVELQQCLGDLTGIRRLEGKGNLSFALTGTGSSVFDLTKSLNGTVTLTSGKGAISGLNVENLLKRLERNPLSRRNDFRSGKTPYDSLAVELKINNGMAQVDNVLLDGQNVRLVLAGSASIPTRNLDLKGTASLMSGTTNANGEAQVAFDLPFVVQGDWDDPIMLPDVQILIRRSGAAAPLLDAVRKGATRDAARSAIELMRRAPAAPGSPTEPAAEGAQPAPTAAPPDAK